MSSVDQIIRVRGQYKLAGFPVVDFPGEAHGSDYFRLNPFLPNKDNRCPLACSYCVCHQNSSWHHHPEQFDYVKPPLNMDETLLDLILSTPEGKAGVPISLFDYTDPFIAAHREHVLKILAAIVERQVMNPIYITTKVHPGPRYLSRLNELLGQANRARVTIFVSLPPLRTGIELVSIENRVRLLKELSRLGMSTCWYMRPMTPKWFDEDALVALARELLPFVGSKVVLSGLILSPEVVGSLRRHNQPIPVHPQANSGQEYLDPEFEQYVRVRLGEIAAQVGVDHKCDLELGVTSVLANELAPVRLFSARNPASHTHPSMRSAH